MHLDTFSVQIKNNVLTLGKHLDINCFACIQATYLKNNLELENLQSHIVIGTAGRIINRIKSDDMSKSNIGFDLFQSCNNY